MIVLQNFDSDFDTHCVRGDSLRTHTDSKLIEPTKSKRQRGCSRVPNDFKIFSESFEFVHVKI